MPDAQYDLITEVVSLRSAVNGFRGSMDKLERTIEELSRSLADGRVKFVEVEARIAAGDAALAALLAALTGRVEAIERAANERKGDLKAIIFPIITQVIIATVAAVATVYAIHKVSP